MKNEIKHAACIAVAFAALAFARDVSAQNHAQHTQSATAKVVAPEPAQQQQPADTTITIQSFGSELEFQPSTIAVKAGKRLRIRYINEGTFPHNIVIAKTDGDIDPLGVAAFGAGSTDYVPLTLKDKMYAFSPLAPPGETIEFTFVVPPAGEYPFVCLYPGHYNMMLGTLKSLR